jgi:acetyl-CoA carboxylase biotin carboxyl carrier protein
MTGTDQRTADGAVPTELMGREPVPGAGPDAVPKCRHDLDGSGAALVEQLRESALRFLDSVAVPPRTLRLRLGEVCMEVEWADEAPIDASAPTASAGPAVPPQAGAPVQEIEPAESRWPSGSVFITAPAVGVMYHAPEPGAPPFVVEGDHVSAGQQVAIVEAMKIMIPVTAERAGRVLGLCKDNGESVEFGENLVALAPGGE